MEAASVSQEVVLPWSTLDVNILIIPLQVPSLVNTHSRTVSDQNIPGCKVEIGINTKISVVVHDRPGTVSILSQSVNLIGVGIGTSTETVPFSPVCKVKICSPFLEGKAADLVAVITAATT